MKQIRNPVRLLVEILVIMAVAQAAVVIVLPTIVTGLAARSQGFLSAALLVLLAGPTLYWRCMAVTRQTPIAPGGNGGSRSSTINVAIAMTAAAQVLGLVLTGACVVWQQHTISQATQEKFDRSAERIESEARRHFTLPLYGLNGLRGMFAADGQVNRSQFRAWVESRNLPAEFPGVRGLGFIQRVKRDDLATFVAEQHADGSPEFVVSSAGDAPDLYLVKYIEPLASNRAALGIDAGREAVRREAAERAASGGLPALSSHIALAQDSKKGPGFLYFVPVYRGGSAAAELATAEQRQSMLIGLLYAPIVASEIMQGVTDVVEGALDIELFEGETARTSDLLFDSQRDASAAKDAPASGGAFQSLRSFVVGGRTLTLKVSSSPAFESSIDRSSLAFVAVAGALASFLMALAVWLLAVGRVRAQRRAQRMTADLARLARVVQHTSNSVVIADAQMRINWVNDGFTRITGYTLEEAAGRTPGELLGSGKADPATIKTLLDAVASGEACRAEILNRTKDGREYWIDTEVQPTRDENGVLVGFMEIGSDITERHTLGEELRRGNELMTGVLQSLPCGLSVIDDKLKLVAHNGQFRKLLDLPDALFDTPEVTFDQVVRCGATRGDCGPGDLEDVVAGVIARARNPIVQFFECERANGLPLDVRRAPIPGGGFVTTYTDVSARKQAEIALKEALARAEQASVAKSQFLANMSHEIRTPMNAILGMLGLLQKTELTTRQLDYASKTEGAARSLLGLLNDILDFSKAEAGKMALDRRPFRLDRLLRDLSVILSANVGTKSIDVLFDIDPAVPPCLLGDDMRLQQVLINLGGNAIKFTGDGEVVLSLRVVERTEADVLLEFAVRDSGIGIAPEHRAHIFTGFSQAEASTTRRFGGTGLGLAICQRLVALMGGELQLRSTLGEGSTFHFQIRLALAEGSGDALASPRPVLGALRTLIVDDNQIAREVLVTIAQSLGWQADAVAGGAEAIALARTRAAQGVPYEAVFVDWQMPEMDGWETSRSLLAEASERPAPLLVMITGHGRETLAQRSAEEQAILSGFLVKPITASMLFDAVSDARVTLAHPGLLNRRPTAQIVQRLVGMRLLVVEDNLNNQQIAQELLTDEGAHVSLADNGQLGVDAVAGAEPPFDAVLMDLQMPVMDGYAATARIRQHLGLTALPIIAMTANAMASDREACLAAGMNDHVGKPFDLSNLVTTLLRHTGRAAAPVTNAEPRASAVPTELLEEAGRRGIALAAALGRMGGNSRAYLRSLQSFLQDLATLPDQLTALMQQGRLDDAKRLMHTFKGMAGTLGIRPLASLAAEVERELGGAEAPAEQKALIEQLRILVATTLRDIAHVAEALRQALPTAAAPCAVADADLAEPADTPGLRRSLDELTSLLRCADMRALEVFGQLQQTHAAHVQGALQPLDDAMATLDFDQALAQCQALKMRLDK